MTTLAGHGKDPRLVQVEFPVVPEHGFKVGDFIKDKDNFIGQIKSACDRCITAFNETCVKSYNLTEFKDINSFIKRLPDIAESELCSPTLTCLAESELSLSQPETLEKSQQSPTSTSTRTRKKSINPTSLKSQSIATSETIAPLKELTSLQEVSPAQEPVEQVQKLDLTTPNLSSGLNISDASKKGSPNLQSSKIPQDYSIAEWEKSSKVYPKAGICVNGRLSPLPYLEVPKREKGSSSLPIPTLTTGLGSGRNAGATKLEKWLKDNQFVQSTQALSAEMMAVLFGFPKNWTECLLESPKESEAETRLEPCLEKPSTSTVQQSHSNESSTSIASLVNLVKARINKTSLEVPEDIAPIFKLNHTVGINIVNLDLLDLIDSLSTDRLRCALELSEKYGGCQKKRELIAKHIKERTSWDKYLNYSQTFPTGCEVEIVDSKRGTGVWVGRKGIVQPYKQTQSDAASISYGIIVKIFSESAQKFANPSFEDSELISVNNIDASSSKRLQFLLEQRDRLIASGASPQGVWICCGKVPHRDFEQAVWKSSTPRKEWGDKKSQYIGKRGKEDHLSAIAQHRAGQELRKVEREIRKLQKS